MAETTQPRVWRKHAFALLDATSTQLFQLGFMLLAVIFGAVISRWLVGTPISLRTSLGIAVAVCGVWTTFHMIRGLAAARAAANEKTPLSRRRALLSKVTAPIQLVIAVVSGTLTITLSVAVLAFLFSEAPFIWVLIASYFVFLMAWLGLEVLDWYNDRYILKEDRIIDITRIPIIYEQRTEAPLAMVQNATTSQKGWGVLFNYGDVTVETAGAARPIMFDWVWRPKLIQEAIFSQIEATAKKKRDREREVQVTQTQRWFEAYHTLTSGIRDIDYDRQAVADRLVRIKWQIEGAPERHYRTWLAWDTASRAGGGEYAYRARPGGLPDYVRADEFDGIGAGSHAVRGLLAPTDARTLFFRIVVWFAGDRASHSSPEMTIEIMPELGS